MFELKIHPINKYVCPRIVNNVFDFEKKQIKKHASKLKFTLRLLPKEKEWVNIECIDGHKHKEIIQIITKGRKKICSCKEFFDKQMSFCIHIAVLDNMEKDYYQWIINNDSGSNFRELYHDFMCRLKAQILKIPNEYSVNGVYWDSYEQKSYCFIDSNKEKEELCSYISYKKYKKQKVQLNKDINTDIIPKLFNTIDLFDYQKEKVEKSLIFKRVVLSMSIGSGKTIVSLAVYSYLLRENPNLSMVVICPKSLKMQWEEEIETHCKGTEVFQIASRKQLEKFVSYKGAKIGILTYQFSNRHTDILEKTYFDIFVLDEIQYIRNSETKTWNTANLLQSEYFLGLSGTVIENEIDDLYNIMKIVDPDILGPKWKFDSEFKKIRSITKTKVLFDGTRNTQKLKELIKDRVLSYEKNLDVRKNSYNLYVKLNEEQKKKHDYYYSEANRLISESLNKEMDWHQKVMIQAFLLKARQSCNSIELIDNENVKSSKVEKFIKLVEDICIKQNKKIIVFSEWVKMLCIAKREVESHFSDIGSVLFTGEKSLNQRKQIAQKFRNSDECKIFFSSDAGGKGLDKLQLVANTVVHLELPWNPARLDQRDGRLYRLMQKNDVDVYHIISENSIESSIESLIDSKRKIRIDTLFS